MQLKSDPQKRHKAPNSVANGPRQTATVIKLLYYKNIVELIWYKVSILYKKSLATLLKKVSWRKIYQMTPTEPMTNLYDCDCDWSFKFFSLIHQFAECLMLLLNGHTHNSYTAHLLQSDRSASWSLICPECSNHPWITTAGSK